MKEKLFTIENYINEHQEIFKKIDLVAYKAASDLIVEKLDKARR